MGKFKDSCKKYVGMTVVSALCLFGGGNEAQAKQAGNDFHLGTRTTTVDTRDYNITDSTYTHHYETSMQIFDGGRMDEMTFRSVSSVRKLGDGYMYVDKSEGKIKNGEMKRKNFDYEQYMLTPDGRKLDCDFFDSNKFMTPKITHIRRNGSEKVETHSMEEVRAHNLKMEIKFKQQARKNGFTEEDVAHFAKVINDVRRSFENGDIGRPTDHYIEAKDEIRSSSFSTNNQERYNQEKGKLTANFMDFVANQGYVN
ncbi:MAG: hypothetical protein IJZ59_07895 [Alphaproteobacteria bacterium]|nr:hypothetical protein [Alphaproteobacteria bacterium]